MNLIGESEMTDEDYALVVDTLVSENNTYASIQVNNYVYVFLGVFMCLWLRPCQ